jgi:hypothetical protein
VTTPRHLAAFRHSSGQFFTCKQLSQAYPSASI